MGFIELLGIGVALAMDAFSVSLCKGLNMPKINVRHAFVIAFFFGAAQAIMPLIGWLLGTRFNNLISTWDHWIAFALLGFIGGKMIYESLAKKETPCTQTQNAPANNAADTPHETKSTLDLKELFVLAVATSIDALAVGITFAFLQVSLARAAAVIGAVTFAISFSGVAIGNFFGARFKDKAELAGGVILVAIGTKILIEHLCGF